MVTMELWHIICNIYNIQKELAALILFLMLMLDFATLL